MNMKKIIFLIFILTLSFQGVSALEIDSYKITSTPIDGNHVENIIELTVTNDNTISMTEGTLNFALDTDIISIKDSFGELEYRIKQENDKQKTTFSFTTPIDAGESRVITAQTITYNIVQKEGYFEYLLVIVPAKDIASFTHILKLENNEALYNVRDAYLIVPEAQITETTEILFIEWTTSLETDKPTVFLARFDQEKGTNWWKIVGITVLGMFAGIILGIGANTAWLKHKQQKALNAAKILNVREQAVLEHIIKFAPVKQYDLVKKLGYTKSNMSKILKRLEFRALISVKKEGKIRIISIGDKLNKGL
jgi:uncharacterized membrane protein